MLLLIKVYLLCLILNVTAKNTHEWIYFVFLFLGSPELWKKISLIVALPATGILWYNANFIQEQPHDMERQEFKEWPHLTIRTKV